MNEEKLQCMDCGGTHRVEYRNPGYGFRSFPRCETCGIKRLDREQENRRKYFGPEPSDFDPSDCGEVWREEDY